MISTSHRTTSSNNLSAQVGDTPHVLLEQEINSLSTKSIEKIITTAEKHLHGLKQPKKTCNSLSEIYTQLIVTRDQELLTNIASVLFAVSLVTGMSKNTYFTNLEKVKRQLESIPSALHKSKEDQDLIQKSNEFIESMEIIIPYFETLNSGIGAELEKLKHPLLFKHFALPLTLYKNSFTSWKNKIEEHSGLCEALFKDLTARALEKHSPSKDSSEILFYSHGLELTDIDEVNLTFSKYTIEIATFPARIQKAKLDMVTCSNKFKKNFNYLSYLCKYELYPSHWNRRTFASFYGKTCYNYIDRPENYLPGSNSPNFSPNRSLNSSNSQITADSHSESELSETEPLDFFNRGEEFYLQAELLLFGYHPLTEFYLESDSDSDTD